MIKIENTSAFGFEAAVRGMRNPMNSWDKSDSFICNNIGTIVECEKCPKGENCDITDEKAYFVIGKNDLKLMKSLSKAGSDHAKFLRMINVTMDITAPLYFFKEFDTYKVGTVANSCSTMHKIHAKEFEMDDFSHEHLLSTEKNGISGEAIGYATLEYTIMTLNVYRNLFLETKDKIYWWQMIQLLPSSYNQKRTVQLNYQVLKTMYYARKDHKLDEWREFCKWCETLPYFRELVVDNV